MGYLTSQVKPVSQWRRWLGGWPSVLLLASLLILPGALPSWSDSRQRDPFYQPSHAVAPITQPASTVEKPGETPHTIRVLKGRSRVIRFATPLTRVSIADPAIADVVPLAPDELMINGRQRGVTSLLVWDNQGQQGMFDLMVPVDTTELTEAIRALAPDDELSIRITDDSLILGGRISDSVVLDEIRRLAGAYGYKDANFVDLTETPTPQVSLTVKIAEANRSVVKDLKVGLGVRASGINLFGTKIDTLPPDPRSTIQAGSLATASVTKTGGLFGAWVPNISQNFGIEARFDLLESEGRIKLLAEPNLVCTHGRTASFLAGGEFPFVSAVNQNGTPVIQFKEFGVRLKFTPWIATRSGRIELRIQPEVSSIDNTLTQTSASGQQIFGLATRKSDTTLELADGESFLLGGLLNKEDTDSLSKVPWAGDLPVLGPFFRNTARQRRDRELVIVVTPHIIRPPLKGPLLQPAGSPPTLYQPMPSAHSSVGSLPADRLAPSISKEASSSVTVSQTRPTVLPGQSPQRPTTGLRGKEHRHD